MMTAMSTFIGLLPLLFGAGQTGKEILYPLTVVVFGGMLTSTLLDQIVTPALFYKFGRKVYERKTRSGMAELALERRADELFPTDLTEDAPAPAPSALPEEGDARAIPVAESAASTSTNGLDGPPEVANGGESERAVNKSST
jgi:hypothetical protein